MRADPIQKGALQNKDLTRPPAGWASMRPRSASKRLLPTSAVPRDNHELRKGIFEVRKGIFEVRKSILDVQKGTNAVP